MKEELIKCEDITRVEIINHADNTLTKGRIMVLYQHLNDFKDISISIQDDGKTLKIFVS